MIFSGFADEAGKDLDSQIRATKELGWSHIEVRNVNGTQFTSLTDAEYRDAAGRLDAAGVRVSALGSALANWARPITADFQQDLDDMKIAVPRMRELGTQYIRAMSWPNDPDKPMDEDAWGDEAVRRMKELAKLAEDGGVTIAIENCDGWASLSPKHYAAFIERVGSPAVKCVYDTGNAASHGRTDTWDWYTAAKPHIGYIHIKAHTGPEAAGPTHTYPDDPSSTSLVGETLKDLIGGGYDGIVSIEPHLKAVVHEGKEISDEEAALQTYVEYGRRVMRLVEEARAG
jgi:sugar phosphate isomerase/epimerase